MASHKRFRVTHTIAQHAAVSSVGDDAATARQPAWKRVPLRLWMICIGPYLTLHELARSVIRVHHGARDWVLGSLPFLRVLSMHRGAEPPPKLWGCRLRSLHTLQWSDTRSPNGIRPTGRLVEILHACPTSLTSVDLPTDTDLPAVLMRAHCPLKGLRHLRLGHGVSNRPIPRGGQYQHQHKDASHWWTWVQAHGPQLHTLHCPWTFLDDKPYWAPCHPVHTMTQLQSLTLDMTHRHLTTCMERAAKALPVLPALHRLHVRSTGDNALADRVECAHRLGVAIDVMRTRGLPDFQLDIPFASSPTQVAWRLDIEPTQLHVDVFARFWVSCTCMACDRLSHDTAGLIEWLAFLPRVRELSLGLRPLAFANHKAVVVAWLETQQPSGLRIPADLGALLPWSKLPSVKRLELSAPCGGVLEYEGCSLDFLTHVTHLEELTAHIDYRHALPWTKPAPVLPLSLRSIHWISGHDDATCTTCPASEAFRSFCADVALRRSWPPKWLLDRSCALEDE